MNSVRLGATGPDVSALGLGCMGISGVYGPVDRAEAVTLVHAALDAGVTLLDLGDFYGKGRGELLIGEALRARRREDAILSVKFGGLRDPAGNWLGHDVRPAAAKTALAYSLTRLGTDYIDIYRPARIDPQVPVEETVGAIGELVDAGYVRHIGLSEVGADTLRRARAERPICDAQLEYSLISRRIEESVLPACRELDVAVSAFGILSRGLLSGHLSAETTLDSHDDRARLPRFQPENLRQNLALVDALRATADARGATVAQLAIAWVASRGVDIVPLFGACTRGELEEALGALTVELSPDDLAEIERTVHPEAAAGERYPGPMLAHLDSEKG
jgi:aryl-alcohol dehydrogenase-like predicted oxidoreductase